MQNIGNGAKSINKLSHDYNLDHHIIEAINEGMHWLSSSDYEYPIRNEEELALVAKAAEEDATQERIDTAKIPYIVYKDINQNYYYFPSTTEAGEWSVHNGYYGTAKSARCKIKEHKLCYDTLEAFIEQVKTSRRTKFGKWGTLNIVPDPVAIDGGFKGEPVIVNGKQLGIKLDIN